MRHFAWHSLVQLGCGAFVVVAAISDAVNLNATAEPYSVVETWRMSPFHGAISGATGNPIPCLCRSGGRNFKLGERVCMHTPNGIVIARCDMHLNNTTWIPTDESCVLSEWQFSRERRHS